MSEYKKCYVIDYDRGQVNVTLPSCALNKKGVYEEYLSNIISTSEYERLLTEFRDKDAQGALLLTRSNGYLFLVFDSFWSGYFPKHLLLMDKATNAPLRYV